jgi:xylulose-5-phosphate/fructose-6-phosphate phosphoketolase
MFNQHAKWLPDHPATSLAAARRILNYLLTSPVLRQDHIRLRHQDPGLRRPRRQQGTGGSSASTCPAGRHTLLSVAGPLPASKDYVNVIVAGKQPACSTCPWRRRSSLHKASGSGSGRAPTAAASRRRPRLRRRRPDAGGPGRGRPAARVLPRPEGAVRQRRRPHAAAGRAEHPTGLSDAAFDALFTVDKPVIFAYHGYPWLIHRLTYRRRNHHNLHVRGYKEEGTTTTPFDMCVINQIDRFPPGHGRPRPDAAAGRPGGALPPASCRTRSSGTGSTSAAHGEDLPRCGTGRGRADDVRRGT